MYCCWIAWYLYLVFSNKCHYNPFLFRAPIPMNSLLQPLVITLSLSPHIRAAASVPMCQCGQTVICPRGQIIRIIALEIFEGLKYQSTVLLLV